MQITLTPPPGLNDEAKRILRKYWAHEELTKWERGTINILYSVLHYRVQVDQYRTEFESSRNNATKVE